MKTKIKRELTIEDLRLMKEVIQKRIMSRKYTSLSFTHLAAHHPIESAFATIFTLPVEMVNNIKNKRDKKRIEKIEKLKILYQNGYNDKIKVKCKCKLN